MGRPTKFLITKQHPTPQFRDKIKLLQFRRSPTDDRWDAIFFRDGKWQMRRPVALGTNDLTAAAEVARVKFTMSGKGQRPTREYTKPEPKKAPIQYPLNVYAKRAIKKMRDQADAADASTLGKGHNFRAIARRIENDLLPRWGATDITKLTEHDLNDWIEDDYRVEDTEATVKLYGRQPRGKDRQKVWKKPGVTTLGNLDHALLHVWQEAVADKIVDRRHRPTIDKALGEDGEPRAFIDAAGVQAVANVMTDDWIINSERDNLPNHSPDMRRMLRTYVAMIATTGIRAGLEAERVQIGHVKFLAPDSVPT